MLNVGMPLLDVIELTENTQIREPYRSNILNFCRQELEMGDSKISNEIELAMLTAWFLNSDKIAMPKLLSDKYKLIDTYSEKYINGTKTYEEFLAEDKTYYLRCITRNVDNIVVKVSLSHRTSSFISQIRCGGTEDFLNDNNGDGLADSRTIIKTIKNDLEQSTKIITDINLDGKID